jgi:hypothetical protein
MPLSQHAILHRKNTTRTRYRGQVIESPAEIEIVRHCYVAPISQQAINRTTEGTLRESRMKLILWNVELLQLQDNVELEGDINSPGTGVLYEVVEITQDKRRLSGHSAYVIRRKQDQVIG